MECADVTTNSTWWMDAILKNVFRLYLSIILSDNAKFAGRKQNHMQAHKCYIVDAMHTWGTS